MRIIQNLPSPVATRPGLIAAQGLPLGSRKADPDVEGVAAADNAKTKVSNSDGESASGNRTARGTAQQPKHEVDRRVADGGTMKVTVISYSDGSHDTLQEIKGGSFDKAAGIPRIDMSGARQPSSKAVLFGGKGMMIDKTA